SAVAAIAFVVLSSAAWGATEGPEPQAAERTEPQAANSDAAEQAPQAPTVGVESQQSPSEPSQAAREPSQPAAEPPRPPQPTLIVRVDLTRQQMTVQEKGRVIRTWRISSGRDGYPTPRGTFRAEWTARMWYSRQYDMAAMPYAVFFKNGSAIHATTETG